MKVSCPQCEQLLALPTHSVGRWARCPRCGAIFALSVEEMSADRDSSSAATKPAETSAYAPSSGAKVETFGESTDGSPTTVSYPVRPPSMALSDWAANLMVQQGEWELQISDGRRFGPVKREVLDQWVREGRVGVDSLLRPESERHWSPAQRLYPYLRTGHGIGRGGTSQRPPAVGGLRHSAADLNRSVGLPSNQGGLAFALSLLGFCCLPLGLMTFLLAVLQLIKVRRGKADREGSYLLWLAMVISILGAALQLGVLAR